MIKYIIVVITSLVLSCSVQKAIVGLERAVVDIEQSFDKRKNIMLSDLIESIEYVKLETMEEFPIDRGLKVYTNDSYLVCIAFRQIYLFDRQTGKFIREIGRYGQGPEEYLASGFYDKKTQHVYAHRVDRGLYEYDMNGYMTRILLQPRRTVEANLNETFSGFFSEEWNLTGRTFLDNSTIVYYNDNRTGSAKDRLLVVNELGNIIYIFPNYNSFLRRDINTISVLTPIFYQYGNNTMFFENCIDTIYCVTKDSLIYHFHLNMGKYKPPYEMKNLLPSPRENPIINQYFIFDNIGESDRFLFFDFSHSRNLSNPSPNPYIRYSFFGYYDKKSGQTKIADVDYFNFKNIVNDVDNFFPLQFNSWTINENNEMISYIEAFDILDWFEANPEKAMNLPEDIQKLSQLNPEDNPVVVIAKLK